MNKRVVTKRNPVTENKESQNFTVPRHSDVFVFGNKNFIFYEGTLPERFS